MIVKKQSLIVTKRRLCNKKMDGLLVNCIDEIRIFFLNLAKEEFIMQLLVLNGLIFGIYDLLLEAYKFDGFNHSSYEV